MNNETFTEAAQALARRVLTTQGDGDDASKIEHAFRLCFSRPPEVSEIDRLSSLLAGTRSFYRANPEEAKKMAGNYLQEKGDPVETASWIATVRVILNLDEFLVRS